MGGGARAHSLLRVRSIMHAGGLTETLSREARKAADQSLWGIPGFCSAHLPKERVSGAGSGRAESSFLPSSQPVPWFHVYLSPHQNRSLANVYVQPESLAWVLTCTNCEPINVCCLKLLNFGVICYTAIGH